MRPALAAEVVLAWRPLALETAADSLAADRSRLVRLEDELRPVRGSTAWAGTAADAARCRVERLRRRLGDLVAEISTVVFAVDSEVPALRATRDELSALLDLEAAAAVAGLLGIRSRIDAALTRAAACDARLEAALQRARSGLVDVGAASLRDAALPNRLRGLSHDELARWALAHPGDASPYLSAMPVGVRRQLGEELAASLATDGPAESLPLLEGLGEDEVVATSALEELGPSGLVSLATSLVSGATVTGRGLAAGRRALGRMLAAGISDDEPPGPRRVSRAWLSDLGRETAHRRVHDARLVTPTRALAPVLRHAARSTALLTTVGGVILTADRAPAEAGLSPLRSTESLHADLAGIDLTDPVAEVLDAAAANPEAARQLLGDADALRHLLVDRDWPEHQEGPGIDALGRALETATTVSPDDRSVAIAEGMVDGLRQRFDEMPGQPDIRADLMDPRLRPHVGAVLGEYLPSLHELMGGPGPGHQDSGIPDAGPRGDLDVPGGKPGARTSVALLLADVGKDVDAGRMLVAEANGHAAELLVHTLRDVPADRLEGAVVTAMTNVVGPHGALVGAVDHGLGTEVRTEQVERDGETEQARRQKVVAGASIAKLLVSEVPIADKALGVGIDMARAEALVALQVDSTGATNREVGMLFSMAHHDQGILTRAVVEQIVPGDLPGDLRYSLALAAENEGANAYLAGRLRAEEWLSDYE